MTLFKASGRLQGVLTRIGRLQGYLSEDAPSIEHFCSKADKALFASVCHNPDHVLADLECATEFPWRQTTGCIELFLLACYVLITRAYECILFCTYNDVCNAECGLQL